MKKTSFLLIGIISLLFISCPYFDIQPRQNPYDPDADDYLEDTTPPGPITDLSLTAGDNGVVLSWTNPADAPAEGVIILRSTAAITWTPEAVTAYTGGQQPATGVTVLHAGSGSTFTDLSAPEDILLYYYLFTYDDRFNYSQAITDSAFREGENTIVDLSVESIQTILDGTDVIGLRVTLKNNGNTDRDLTYTLYLSSDTIISDLNDQLIYEDTVQVDKGRSRIIDLGLETDIHPYMAGAGISMEAGDYYIGVKADRTDAVSEDDESNNEAVSPAAQSFDAVYLDGTVTLAMTNAADYEGLPVYFGIYFLDADPADGHEASGTFNIASGEGSFTAVSADDEEVEWIAPGGEACEIYWMIDMNENMDLENMDGPDTGDITGDSLVIDLLNGDTTVTIDPETMGIPKNSAVAYLDYPEAAGNKVLFFLFETADEDLMSSEDPDAWIKASGESEIDSEGQAMIILREGWLPAEDAAIFYPAEGTLYNLMTAIDVNGNIMEHPVYEYEDPYDYHDIGFEGDENDGHITRFTGGEDYQFTFTSDDYAINRGLIVDAGGTQADLGDPELLFTIIRVGETDADGGAVMTAGDSDGLVVIKNVDDEGISEDRAWSPYTETNYTLQVVADTDESGTLSTGELFADYEITYTDTAVPMTHYIGSGDFRYYVDSTAGLYSETTAHTPLFTYETYDENCNSDTASTAITAWEGTEVLELECSTDNTDDPNWYHMTFNNRVSFTENITHIHFRMNIESAPDLTQLDYLISDGANMDGANIIGDPAYRISGPDANGWSEYAVPLLGDNSESVDPNIIESINFGYARDETGYYTCTIYFDDIYFE